MPFTSKDQEILRSMQEEYGTQQGTRVFYASATKGKLGKDAQKRHGSGFRSKGK